MLDKALEELAARTDKVSSRSAAGIAVMGAPLLGYANASVPQVRLLLSIEEDAWRRFSRRKKVRKEAEVRKKLMKFLRDSEMVRKDTAKVLKTARGLR